MYVCACAYMITISVISKKYIFVEHIHVEMLQRVNKVIVYCMRLVT